jgi:hypothetical protein
VIDFSCISVTLFTIYFTAPRPNNPNNNANGDAPNEQQEAPPPPRQNGILGEIGLIISSFVYSLFPTYQQPQIQRGNENNAPPDPNPNQNDIEPQLQ